MIKILKKSPGILTFKLATQNLFLKEGINELQENEFTEMTEHRLYEELAKALNLTVIQEKKIIEEKKGIGSAKNGSNKKNTNKLFDALD